MPQATDALRARWADKKGNITDELAINHLLKRGFVFTRGGIIHCPPGLVISLADYSAVEFMADEMDFDYDLTNAVRYTNEGVFDRLSRAFGGFLDWPAIQRWEPKWWHFVDWIQNREMNDLLEEVGLPAIGQDGRDAFFEQLMLGQGYTDATGFRLRCWCAALGQPFLPADVSYSTIKGNLEKLRQHGQIPW